MESTDTKLSDKFLSKCNESVVHKNVLSSLQSGVSEIEIIEQLADLLAKGMSALSELRLNKMQSEPMAVLVTTEDFQDLKSEVLFCDVKNIEGIKKYCTERSQHYKAIKSSNNPEYFKGKIAAFVEVNDLVCELEKKA